MYNNTEIISKWYYSKRKCTEKIRSANLQLLCAHKTSIHLLILCSTNKFACRDSVRRGGEVNIRYVYLNASWPESGDHTWLLLIQTRSSVVYCGLRKGMDRVHYTAHICVDQWFCSNCNYWLLRHQLPYLTLLTYSSTYVMTPCSRVLFGKLTGSQSKNSPHFIESEGSLPYSQVLATWLYPETARSSPRLYIPLPEYPS